MKKQKQLYQHDPAHEIYGDCYRTCIACLLDMEPGDVPHFMAPEFAGQPDHETNPYVRRWLKDYGLQHFRVGFEGVTFEQMLDFSREANPGVRMLISGEGQNDVGHVVIVKDGEVEWNTGLDYDPDQPDLVGPDPLSGQFIVEIIGELK